MYWSVELIKDIYLTLAQDPEFVEMMLSVWKIELSMHIVVIYRVLVMYRQSLVRTDSGYNIPTEEEVIAGIKAYFNPSHNSGEEAPLHHSGEEVPSHHSREEVPLHHSGEEVPSHHSGEEVPLQHSGEEVPSAADDTCSQRIRAVIINILQGNYPIPLNLKSPDNIQGCLLYSIQHYIIVWLIPDPPMTNTIDRGSGFTCPIEVSEAIAKASTATDLKIIRLNCGDGALLKHYLSTWIALQYCLENPDALSACECLFLYFFVKRCLDRGLGVPKLALALYDRMNMQLSRKFIRCANPTCKHNKLDQSTGQVKFKKCSRCRAVIYCSCECQVAHYPEHKRLCRERLTG